MYIAIKGSNRKGVYREENFKNEWRGKGISIREFSANELDKALKWAGVKGVNGVNFSVKNFLKKYRETKNVEAKIKMIARLKKEEKALVVSKLTPQELQEYKKNASTLIERRYACIRRNKKCLDEVTADNPNLSKIRQKYLNVDLSIPVYTIKAIINVHEGIGFSKDDYKYSKNANKYYKQCKWYWERIIDRWDTDTGVLSKEDIENRNFSEYHKNANKVRTIIKQLALWKEENVY